MYVHNPDRRSMLLMQRLDMEKYRQYPHSDSLNLAFLSEPRQQRFSITRASKIASIGSCFAREIKRWLQANGFCFIEKAVGPCADAGSARHDRVYNTFTIRQEFERAFGDFRPIEQVWKYDDGERTILMDPYRKNLAWDTPGECAEELEQHRRDVRDAFTVTDVLIVTVGCAVITHCVAVGSQPSALGESNGAASRQRTADGRQPASGTRA